MSAWQLKGMLHDIFYKLAPIVQSPLDTFPRNFPIDGKVANLLKTRKQHGELPWHVKIVRRVTNKSATSWQQVVVMEFGKWHDTALGR